MRNCSWPDCNMKKLQNDELQLIIAIISSKNYCKLICPYPWRQWQRQRGGSSAAEAAAAAASLAAKATAWRKRDFGGDRSALGSAAAGRRLGGGGDRASGGDMT
jgi:hypothetical protein